MKILNRAETQLLRDLAGQVADIAHEPAQEERRKLWRRHNRLENVGPLFLAFPEGAWRELLPHESLAIDDPFWSEIEWNLKHIIYHFEHHHDDHAIEPVFRVPRVLRHSGWGIEPKRIGPDDPTRAWKWDPPLKDPRDSSKLKFPELEYDDVESNHRLGSVEDVFGDILEIRYQGACWWNPASIIGVLAGLRGLDQLMFDMVDRPEWVHETVAFLANGSHRLLKQLEAEGLLELTNQDQYVGSGGLAYSDELPTDGYDGTRVRLIDTWGFAEAQEISEVSPRMHEEFCLQYQIPLLEEYGLNCYNCCEDITHKFGIIKKVPRLRRVSVSPFTDRRVAAEELTDEIIYSWKPNPVMLAADYDPGHIRRVTRETLEIARGCVVEMVMKDTHTVQGQAERFTVWTDICREEADRARDVWGIG